MASMKIWKKKKTGTHTGMVRQLPLEMTLLLETCLPMKTCLAILRGFPRMTITTATPIATPTALMSAVDAETEAAVCPDVETKSQPTSRAYILMGRNTLED
mmetsp:Transcript_123292/g.217375  ORF Transcript_123292/g.217375 Transcript_123292/m.217375 type:complete len:101 (-) Transcript_123292:41-343(-)